MGLLTPDYIFKDVTRITPEFLRRHGIRGLVLDVDNTLTEHGSHELRPQVAAWLALMRKKGVHMMIASNNVEQRVAPFAQKIGLDYISFCCKPSPYGLMAARRKWGLPRSQMALVGDQIFTDAWAGALYGVKVLLVRPIARDPKPSVRLKRRLEKPFLLRYYKRGGKLL